MVFTHPDNDLGKENWLWCQVEGFHKRKELNGNTPKSEVAYISHLHLKSLLNNLADLFKGWESAAVGRVGRV